MWNISGFFDFVPTPVEWPQWGRKASATTQASDFSNVRTVPVPDGCDHATGWPLPAFWYEAEISPLTGAIKLCGGIPLAPFPTTLPSPLVLHTVYALPYRPIYPGLILNSIFWGALAFGIVSLCGYTRRSLRLRRNLCPTCAYNLRNIPTPGCPECGWNRPSTAT